MPEPDPNHPLTKKARFFNGVDFGCPSIIQFAPGLTFMSLNCLCDLLQARRTFCVNFLKMLGVPLVEVQERKLYFRYEVFMLMLAHISLPGDPRPMLTKRPVEGAANNSFERLITRRINLPTRSEEQHKALVESLSDPQRMDAAIKSITSACTALGGHPSRDTLPFMLAGYRSVINSLAQYQDGYSSFDQVDSRTVLPNLGLSPFEIEVYRAWGFLNEQVQRERFTRPYARDFCLTGPNGYWDPVTGSFVETVAASHRATSADATGAVSGPDAAPPIVLRAITRRGDPREPTRWARRSLQRSNRSDDPPRVRPQDHDGEAEGGAAAVESSS